MTDLEQAHERIQVICEKIRAETLEPAKDQAQAIIEQAKKDADHIRQAAKAEAEKIHHDARKQLEQEKQIFQSSLHQAARQTLDMLKQKIEKSLFDPTMSEWVQSQLGDEKDHARLIDVIVQAIEKEGIRADLSVKIPQQFSADTINALISKNILEHLKNNSVEVSDINGGIQVGIDKKHLTIDISAKTLEEIVLSFIHKSFRKVFFNQ